MTPRVIANLAMPTLPPPPEGGWRLGLIGNPVAHSLSPAMHNAALRVLGIAGQYVGWPTEDDDVAARAAALRDGRVLGANVTVPHKRAITAYLDSVTALAARVGAVNTIIPTSVGLVGDNTDVYGFMAALAVACGDLAGKTAVVLGAGGASRAVVVGLEAMGLSRVLIANRNPVRAEDLIQTLQAERATALPLEPAALRRAFAQTAVVVNTTALGWHPGEIPIAPELLDHLPGDAHVTDLTYRDTDLLQAARDRGLGTSDGLEMLVLQGARSLERWTGLAAPVGVMRDAALAARS